MDDNPYSASLSKSSADTKGKPKGKQKAVLSDSDSSEDASSASSSDSDSKPPSRRPASSLPAFIRARSLAAQVVLQYTPVQSLLNSNDSIFLDFACGAGALSHHVAEHIDRVLGIDIHPPAVAEFNLRAQNQGLDKSEMYAIACDVLDSVQLDHVCAEWLGKIDIAACAMGFHHLPDMASVTKSITSNLLRSGGFMCVVDLLWTESTQTIFQNLKNAKDAMHHSHVHSHDHTHAHHIGGIRSEDILKSFQFAQLVDIEVFEYAFELPVMIPEKLLPESMRSSRESSSQFTPSNPAKKIEIMLPFLFAVGRKK
ncbi:S-adenosyl-L-methionine-dependent methyltransferase [Kockiozyma suomiensis]|uniref:S-adenosyl-L-methionine-dependent methyltransferase n=1 Tax=Kockiozyma suomiensis TaxID=1337062 RepID=UPI0033431FD5